MVYGARLQAALLTCPQALAACLKACPFTKLFSTEAWDSNDSVGREPEALNLTSTRPRLASLSSAISKRLNSEDQQ
jgi:hypothetical protein